MKEKNTESQNTETMPITEVEGDIETKNESKLSEKLTTFKAWPKRKKVGVITGAAAIVLLLIGGGIAVAFGSGQNNVDEEPVVTPLNTALVQEVKEQDCPVSLTIKVKENETEVGVKAKVEILDDDGEVAIEGREVDANSEVLLGKLPDGAYTLYITQAPIHVDGSTYALPEKPTEFVVDDEGDEVNLEVELESLAVEDMTQEQLEASAIALEEVGNKDAAKSVRDKAKDAPSVDGSGNVGDSDNNATGTSSSESSSSSGSSSNNSGSGSGSNNSDNTSTKKTPIYGDDTSKPIYGNGAPIYGNGDPIKEERSICNTCGEDITGNTTAHGKAHVLAGEAAGYRGEYIIVGYTQVIVGYEKVIIGYEQKIIGYK